MGLLLIAFHHDKSTKKDKGKGSIFDQEKHEKTKQVKNHAQTEQMMVSTAPKRSAIPSHTLSSRGMKLAMRNTREQINFANAIQKRAVELSLLLYRSRGT
jgi:hypothetical protein